MKRFFVWSLIIATAVSTSCRAREGSTQSHASSHESSSSGDAQRERFEPWLDMLDDSLKGASDLDEAAKQFLDGNPRIAAYHLQALGRIYQGDDKWFKKLRSEFQDVEDTIGEYDKWNGILKADSNSFSKEAKKTLEKNRKDALKEVKELLSENGWFGSKPRRTDVIREELKKQTWKSRKKDREAVLTYIADAFKEMAETEYKFETLEEGNGLHEFRRDMKWLVIEMRALNGLILKSSDSCPAPIFKKLPDLPVAKSRYSKYPPSDTEKNPCYVSECLILGLVQAVDDFGGLKDKAEVEANKMGVVTDSVPEDIKKSADWFYKDISESRLFALTGQQIEACLK